MGRTVNPWLAEIVTQMWSQISGIEVNIVSWMRGLNRHPAKVLFVVIRAVGSNPTLTANFRPTSTMAVHWFCNPVMAVRFCRGAPIIFNL